MALTIRTTESQDELIAELCSHLRIKTASKLFIHLLESYEKTQLKIDALEESLDDKKEQFEEAETTIHYFKESFNGLMDYKIKGNKDD